MDSDLFLLYYKWSSMVILKSDTIKAVRVLYLHFKKLTKGALHTFDESIHNVLTFYLIDVASV